MVRLTVLSAPDSATLMRTDSICTTIMTKYALEVVEPRHRYLRGVVGGVTDLLVGRVGSDWETSEKSILEVFFCFILFYLFYFIYFIYFILFIFCFIYLFIYFCFFIIYYFFNFIFIFSINLLFILILINKKTNKKTNKQVAAMYADAIFSHPEDVPYHLRIIAHFLKNQVFFLFSIFYFFFFFFFSFSFSFFFSQISLNNLFSLPLSQHSLFHFSLS